jgi:hypothetical protein
MCQQEAQEAAQLLKEAMSLRKSFMERSHSTLVTPAGSPLRGITSSSAAKISPQSLDRSFSSMRMGTSPMGQAGTGDLGHHKEGTVAPSSTIMSSKR